MFHFDQIKKADKITILIVFAIIAYGLAFLYSATYRDASNAYATVMKQSLWIGAGIFVMLLIACIDLKRLRAYLYFIYGLNIFFLVLVSLVGKTSLGAQRWIPLGSFNFQPSELGKLLIIITLATYLSEKREKGYGLKDFVLASLHVGIPLLLVFKQPDLGTSLVFLMIFIGSLVFAKFPARYIATVLVSCVMAGFVAVKAGILSEYQMNRLLVFIDPNRDPLGTGYNLLQSQIAIGSGGLFGKGYMSGTQTGLNFLPHHDTDFIFSVVGEEWGFIGGLILLLMFSALIFRCIYLALVSRNKFGEVVAGGIVSMLFFQILVNMGMTIGLMPITGIPLPFISYGGSAMISNLAIVGLLLNISSRRLESI